MNKSSNRSTLKNGIYTAISPLVLLILFEVLASIFYYHQYGKRKLALAELYYTVKTNIISAREIKEKKKIQYRNQQLVRPDSSSSMNQAVYDETIAANQFVYEPWVGFRNKDFSGRYVNTSGFERKSIPAFIQKGADTLTIWFLGGSTLFGFNVADAETIPSRFADLYWKDSTQKKTLRIKNYAIPYYYSYHEYRLLSLLLEREPQPDLVVFVDGLNDFWSYGNTYDLKPYFSEKVAAFINQQQETAPSITNDTRLTDAQTDTLARHYIQTVALAKQLLTNKGIKSLFVLQPVPFYNYPNRNNDPVCSKNEYPVFAKVYPRLETYFRNDSSYLFLGNQLEHETGLPFVDAIHYSPAFSNELAVLMYQKLKHLF